jgi:hypothetical protein
MAANVAMTKPLRSPVLGYNHNLRYRGRVFHVQTEDSGPVNPHLFTHLFFEGTILSSKKHSYDAEVHEDSVKLLMQQLHKAMIRELTHGDHDPRVIAFFAARGQQAFADPAPAAPAPAAEPAPAPVVVAAAPAAEAPVPVEIVPAPAPQSPQSPNVIQVTGVVTGSLDSGPRRPAPAAAAAGRITPRPVVMVRPTDMKRPPMAFSSSADGVVVQRNVVISVGEPAPRIRPAAVIGDASGVSAPHASATISVSSPSAVASAAAAASALASVEPPRKRIASPIEKPFTDLVSDKSLDEVILEYLSDDGEPESR